ncbi:MAG: ABC transporter permease [Candidatus Aminicenantes bacterium]|nr:MAG: ABC transporter permease [Candidatus Aminicenantes bacterium]
MFKNYLKIALRNIKRHKGYSFINIVGLAIGISCCMLMLMWVQDELSYDRFHENSNELSRVLLDPMGASPTHEAVSPPVLAAKMKDEFPEVINTTRLSFSGPLLFSHSEKAFYEERGLYADPSFFEMFTFPFIKGDQATALSALHSLVITEELANKYFGSENPIGKTITLNKRRDYKVTGVLENIPHNSHLQFSYVRPFILLKELGVNLDSWGNVSFFTYVQLRKNSSLQEVNNKLKKLIEKDDPAHNMYYLQPLTRIHLHSKFNFDIPGHGNIMYVYIFAAAAVFILFIACINFMNLATARSGTRSKEVGVRKVVGALRTDIIKQFFLESTLLSLIALVFSIFLIELLVPVFNNLSGKQLALDYSGSLFFIFVLIGITLFTGLVSGSYPSLFLSSFHPVKVIRGFSDSGTKGAMLRKTLVVTQFVLTVVLLVGVTVIHNQLDHIRKKDLGYDKDQLVCFRLRGDAIKKFDTLKAELLQNPNITNVTATSALPTSIGSGTSGAGWEGKDPAERIQMQITWVDKDYLETFRMKMAEGRFFSKEFSTDEHAFILNEAAIKAMRMDSPIGKRFSWGRRRGQIIGVVRNFHYKSLHNEIEPLILLQNPQRIRYACARVKADDISGTIGFTEGLWNKFAAGFPFKYDFLDDRLSRLYRAEQRVGTLFNYFTSLSIFIACLGLFGLSSFTAEQRTKEIGIRKVLGASIPNILLLLTKEFTKLVLVASFLAWPLAYFIMNMWLQNFVSRTSIQLETLALSGVLALGIALLTVSYQSIRVAVANPVDSLKYE